MAASAAAARRRPARGARRAARSCSPRCCSRGAGCRGLRRALSSLDPQTRSCSARRSAVALALPGGRARSLAGQARRARRRPRSRSAAARTPRGPRTREVADEACAAAARASRAGALLVGAAGVAGAGLAARARRCRSPRSGPGVGDAPDQHAVAARARGWSTSDGEPLRADDIEIGRVRTALPEGADKRELGSPVVVVRVDPRTLKLPRAPARLGARGHPRLLEDLHARGLRGRRCSATRRRADAPAARRSSARATTRPSTSRAAAEAVFGPAGRPLPQLPLAIDAPTATLGPPAPLSGRSGPAWWSVTASEPPASASADVVARRRPAPAAPARAARARRCATSSPTTGRSCWARSRCTRSSSSSRPASTSRSSSRPATRRRVYHGRFAPLQGARDDARLPLDARALLDVPGGLLMRQTHHWAALVFVAAMVVHLLRVFFTAAFRKPARAQLAARRALLALACSRASPATRCPTTCCQRDGPGDRLLGRAVDPAARRLDRARSSGAASSRARR